MASQWSLGGAFRLTSLREAVEDITKALRRLEAWVRSPVVLGSAEVQGGLTVGGNVTSGGQFVATGGAVASARTARFTAGASDGGFTLGFRNGAGTTIDSEHAVLSFDYAGVRKGGITFWRGNSDNLLAVTVEIGGTEVFRWKSTGQQRFVPLAADPSGAENGDVYYNSTTNKLRVRAGGAWVDLH